MNTTYLEEFLVFAEEMNYSSAAKRLFITRPTLREHIAEIERELGTTLISRRANSLALTTPGKRFVKRAQAIVDLVAETIEEYHSLDENLLTVTIGDANLCWLEGIIYRARKNIIERLPSKSVDIATTHEPTTSLQTLIDGSSDLTVVGFKHYSNSGAAPELPEGIDAFILRNEEIKLFVTGGNVLFDKGAVSIEDIDKKTFLLPPDIYEGYMRDGVVDYFKRNNADIVLATGPFNDYFEYFASEFDTVIGIIPECLIPRFGIDERDDCQVLSLSGIHLSSDFYVAYRHEFIENENARVFVDELKKLAKELNDGNR